MRHFLTRSLRLVTSAAVISAGLLTSTGFPAGAVTSGCQTAGTVDVGPTQGADAGGGLWAGSSVVSTCGPGPRTSRPSSAPPCAYGRVEVLPPNPSTCWVDKLAFEHVDPNVPSSASCVSYVDVVVGTPTAMQAQFDTYARGQVAKFGWCPATPPPSVTAANFFTTRQLPSPAVQIQPGEAVVGLLAYMQINAPTTMVFTITDGLGNRITITAIGSFHVDWGDGSPIENVGQDHGGPYPSGDITHAYQTAGSVNVIVTETWSASWSSQGALGNLGGAIAGRSTVGELTNFPVRDVQANRDQ